MNPNAQIKAINLIHRDLNENPTKALKVVQMAVGAKLGYIPSVSVSGTNLIGISENTLRLYIGGNISQNAIEAFSLLQKNTNSKQESNFEFILNYLKRLDEYLEKGLDIDQYGDVSQKIGDYNPAGIVNDKDTKAYKKTIDQGKDRHGYGKDQETNAIIEFAHKHIWKNVQQMNATNKPISGASKRDFMPQTDPPANGWDSALKSGEVNWKQECLVLSGLIIRD